MKPTRRPARAFPTLATLAALAIAAVLPATAWAETDLRQFQVGMKVQDLPATGYQDFACADAPDITLKDWSGYGQCPTGKLGFHAVSFRFSESSNPLAAISEDAHGTRVAGHPVLISLLIGDDGIVHGLRIATDPKAHLYLHKKAFLFAGQVRAHYGDSGWQCTDAKPHGDEQPIGDVFIDRTCTKQTATRSITVVQQLFRHAGEPLKDFVSATEMTVLTR